MKCKIIILYFVILTLISVDANLFTLKKCCPLGQQLNLTLTGCQNSTNKKIKNEWQIESGLLKTLPKKFLRSIPEKSNNESIFNIPCKVPKVATMMFMDDDPDFFINRDTGVLTVASMSPLANKQFNTSEYCLDEMQSDEGMMATVALVCPCLRGTCVNLCCERGMLVNITSDSQKAECMPARSPWSDWRLESISVPSQQQNFFAAYGAIPTCKAEASGPHILNYNNGSDPMDPKYNFKVLANGTLHIHDIVPALWVQSSEYCVGVVELSDGYLDVNAIMCTDNMNHFSHPDELMHAQIYSALFLVGALFLLATLIVHALLPELRRAVRGLSLMSHCACMFVAHIALTIVQLKGSTLPDGPCHFLAYLIQYSLLAGFFWMNVICIDISSTFRSLRSMMPGTAGILRKFLIYTTYAMGIPFLIFLITFWADASTSLPVSIRPNIGKAVCWFDKSKESLAIVIFFYGPLGILLLFNLCLFVFTAYKILEYTRDSMVNNQDSQRHDRRNSDKKKFVLFLKLFGLMGIPWIMEIISWAVGGKEYYWYFTDAVNLLRSVFIFIMFCCKKKVWHMLIDRHPKLTHQISKRLPGSSPRGENSDTTSVDTVNTLRSNKDRPAVEEIAMDQKC